MFFQYFILWWSFLTWFGHGFPVGRFVSVGSFLITVATWYSGFFLLSFVSCFARDIGQGVRFGFEFRLRSSPSGFSGFVNLSRPADYFTACHTLFMRPSKVKTAVHGSPYLPTLPVFTGVAKFFMKSPGNYLPRLFSFFLFINFVGNVLLLHWKKWNPPSPQKKSANKNGSHFEHFWGCLQVFCTLEVARYVVPLC